MAQNVALTALVSLTKWHEAVAITYTLKHQVLRARNGVDHECVVARLQLVEDATSQSMHASCSQRDKSKRRSSQLIDMSMLRDERCETEFRRRFGKHKCSLGFPWKNNLMNYSTHFAVLPSEPSGILAKFLLHPGFRSARGKLFSWKVLSGSSSTMSGNVPKRFSGAMLSTGGCNCSPSLSHLVKA